MFEVAKPRQFHYQPRFYDPEKEKWEALKKKYAIEQERKAQQAESSATATTDSNEAEGGELAYFEQRVHDLDQEQRQRDSHLTWRDLIRRRPMPKFNYQPRFASNMGADGSSETALSSTSDSQAEALTSKYAAPKHTIKIRRRFDISDTDYMKPISGTKIILYCFLVFLLVMLIL